MKLVAETKPQEAQTARSKKKESIVLVGKQKAKGDALLILDLSEQVVSSQSALPAVSPDAELLLLMMES